MQNEERWKPRGMRAAMNEGCNIFRIVIDRMIRDRVLESIRTPLCSWEEGG